MTAAVVNEAGIKQRATSRKKPATRRCTQTSVYRPGNGNSDLYSPRCTGAWPFRGYNLLCVQLYSPAFVEQASRLFLRAARLRIAVRSLLRLPTCRPASLWKTAVRFCIVEVFCGSRLFIGLLQLHDGCQTVCLTNFRERNGK